MPRSPLLHGLRLTLRHPRPLIWAYAFNLAIAWLTTLGIRSQYSSVTANSLASQRLITGFDLGVAIDAARRLSDGPPGSLTPSFLTTPLYALIFFLLVPGTLLTYQTATGLRLGTLLQTGLQSFWSFVRITLLFLLVAAPTIALLTALQSAAANRIDRMITGRPAFLLNLTVYLVLFLAAALLRLFFDLVEVHAIHQSQSPLPNGKPDRRIRKSLRPALTTLRRHLLPAYFTFVFLTLLGTSTAFLLTRSALHHLAQPRIWPTFLLAQLAVFFLLVTRFWATRRPNHLRPNRPTPGPPSSNLHPNQPHVHPTNRTNHVPPSPPPPPTTQSPPSSPAPTPTPSPLPVPTPFPAQSLSPHLSPPPTPASSATKFSKKTTA